MAPRNNRHVVQRPDGSWGHRKEGSGRVTGSSTQADAIKSATKATRGSGGGEVVIHGRDGQIREKNTIDPAKDPSPPKG